MARKKVKKERKRLKVLSDRKRLTTDAKATYSTNETHSRLLSMPAEVRNRIYRHVLGDKNIHMKESGHPLCLCSATQTDREAAEAAIEAQREIGFLTWQENHDECGMDDLGNEPYIDSTDADSDNASDDAWDDMPKGNSGTTSRALQSSLSLLRVCRQIHSDAALLPFTTNTFIFDWPRSVSHFVKQLVPEQRRAITSITVSTQHPSYGAEIDSFPRKRMMQTLTGLRHFTLLVEVHSRGIVRADLLAELSEKLGEASELLKWAAWETAVVCVTSEHNQTRHGMPILQAEDFRMESRRMEHTILYPWDAEAEARRKQDERERRHELREQTKRESEAKRDAKAKAAEIENGQRVAVRAQKGLRKVKVASYGA